MTKTDLCAPRERLLGCAPGSAAGGKPDTADDTPAGGRADDLSIVLRARPSG